MPEAERLLDGLEEQVERAGLRWLAITSVHARMAGGFTQAHKDPFDRMLAAQARVEKLVVLSADGLLDGFGVERVW